MDQISLDACESDYLLASYAYELPAELIANRPAAQRDQSRLMVYHAPSDQVTHAHFSDLPQFLSVDDLLVMNETKVFPCRLFGQKSTGAKTEVFVLNASPNEAGLINCLIKTGSKKKVGDVYHLAGDVSATLKELKDDGSFYLDFGLTNLTEYLQEHAQIPIPPYIRDGRSDERDREDYQTVFAKNPGSVAAPTAGLHFTPEVLANLQQRGVDLAQVTLHVGIGTFAPVKTTDIREHKMHYEDFFVTENNLNKLSGAKSKIAVGTTSLRVLESIEEQQINPDRMYSTNIFLHPPKKIRSIRGLITNFHLPKSSLLMLVSALVGREKMLELYRLAIQEKYRFFSYGDAMLILLEDAHA